AVIFRPRAAHLLRPRLLSGLLLRPRLHRAAELLLERRTCPGGRPDRPLLLAATALLGRVWLADAQRQDLRVVRSSSLNRAPHAGNSRGCPRRFTEVAGKNRFFWPLTVRVYFRLTVLRFLCGRAFAKAAYE